MLIYLNTKELVSALRWRENTVEQRLTTSATVVVPLSENWTLNDKKHTLTLKVVNETVINTVHHTNFQLSNSRNRLV